MASETVSKGSKRLKLSPNDDDVRICTTNEDNKQGQSIDSTLDEKAIKSVDKDEAM